MKIGLATDGLVVCRLTHAIRVEYPIWVLFNPPQLMWADCPSVLGLTFTTPAYAVVAVRIEFDNCTRACSLPVVGGYFSAG